MKYIFRLILMVVLGYAFCLADASANAELRMPVNAPRNQTPLMVIRFNVVDPLYEQPLYDTVSKALQVKPSATFDIVSIAQKASDDSEQQRFNEVAARNSRKVMNTLHEMGMPENRLNFTTATEPVQSSEVRIFVH